jgi:hypothetical protein
VCMFNPLEPLDTTRFNTKYSTLCSLSAFLCFVWISEQSGIIQHSLIGFYNRDAVFTARYELKPSI